MGYLNEGILGGITGKVGTVVGGTWRGIDYIRSKGRIQRDRIPTENQQMQQAKFRMAAAFFATMVDLVEFGFREFAVKMTGRNSAMSYALENAITGQHPNWQLDYSRVLVTRGSKVPNADAPAATATAPGAINFQWTDNTGTGRALADDKVVLVAHCPEKASTIYKVSDTVRSAEAAVLDVTFFGGMVVHCWISFTSADKSRVGSSEYLGQFTVL